MCSAACVKRWKRRKLGLELDWLECWSSRGLGDSGAENTANGVKRNVVLSRADVKLNRRVQRLYMYQVVVLCFMFA